MSVKMPTCSWCGRSIFPKEKAVRFPCPNCGEVVIWRCEKCKKLGNPYECPSCKFVGP
jgi:hypothetical protein